MVQTKNINIAGTPVEITFGKLGWLSPGSVMLKMGGTVLLANVTVDNKDTELDYFPLSVEYIEKMYARGVMSGSRFKKREGMPSDEATIKAREVDHSIRSLFPKSFKKPVMLILTVLAYDGIHDPQSLTVLGSSLALIQSGVPFAGPCSSVVVGIDESDNFVINPKAEDREKFRAEFMVSGVDDKILCFEGWGKEILEQKMNDLLDTVNAEIKSVNAQQIQIMSDVSKALNISEGEFDNKPAPGELIDMIYNQFKSEITEALYQDEKSDRNNAMSVVKDNVIKSIRGEEGIGHPEFTGMDISNGLDYVARKILRAGVLNESKRVSGRSLDEVRELQAEIDVLPTVHGSALFSRGLTQSLSIVTLAPKSFAQQLDEMEGEEIKSFMHHYNFPPFSVGEAGRYKYHPGRREVGHGAIGENALKNMVPSQEDFPYAIRVVSEIMTSNGSTSMAATTASSMALMAAGVPMKEQVAGIGVGLVTDDENVNNYKLLLDIEGIEDFYGDMDFKVCGTKNGITAIQYENKLQGVPISIIKEAFLLAKKGREQLLEAQNKVISESRKELPANAPKVEVMHIKQEEISVLIGPGGKNIKELVEKSKQFAKVPADVSIEQDGTVFISAINSEQMNYITSTISEMFVGAEVGKVYEGVVDKVMNFGAFVDVTKNISGLLHISEMDNPENKRDAQDLIKSGTKIKVKVVKIDPTGRISFSAKGF
jgi:polyribonucleotide nucleotidyltransferase